jgi:hypothetical protein
MLLRRTVRAAPIALVIAAVATLIAGSTTGQRARAVPALAGRDERDQVTHRPTIEAAFLRESYAPGQVARLVIWSRGRGVSVQLYRAGTETENLRVHDEMLGTGIAPALHVGSVARGRVIPLRIGDWPSGLYFAKLIGAHGAIGYAPFVLRPRRLGEHSVAVVLSTMTWQAYNFHDDDGNGTADTWYAGGPHARLGRPYENRGVIPHYKYYEQPFLRWLIASGRDVDYLADADLDRRSTTGRRLAGSYELLVFPGHHEYVTPHEYGAVTAFRNLGGNLIFLSANNFFWRTVKHDNVMTRTDHWRNIGRPEAALVGVQYFCNDNGQHRGVWYVRPDPLASWIFDGTGLRTGDAFGNGGIEGDQTAPSSPPGTQVLAAIPDLFGNGRNAEMSYYETKNGAKVFAAGAFTLADEVWWPEVGRVIANLLARLADDGNRARF